MKHRLIAATDRCRGATSRGRALREWSALLVCAVPVCFAVGCSECAEPPVAPIEMFAEAPCDSYFPEASGATRPIFDESERAWFESALSYFDEPCLPEANGGPQEAYRFLWLRTFDASIVVRIERRGDRFFGLVKVGPPYPEGAKLHDHRRGANVVVGPRVLSDAEVAELHRAMESSEFWLIPPRPQGPNDMDGAHWILEAARDGKYRVVQAWSPMTGGTHVRFGELCQTVFRLAGGAVHADRVY